mmetsp:Transcript_10506/g.21870  ORF Transcript_10506/g.21870 Transcript_10506/m.21870 type:complete len:200 (-) Transcript_10506:496-1095(-)
MTFCCLARALMPPKTSRSSSIQRRRECSEIVICWWGSWCLQKLLTGQQKQRLRRSWERRLRRQAGTCAIRLMTSLWLPSAGTSIRPCRTESHCRSSPTAVPCAICISSWPSVSSGPWAQLRRHSTVRVKPKRSCCGGTSRLGWRCSLQSSCAFSSACEAASLRVSQEIRQCSSLRPSVSEHSMVWVCSFQYQALRMSIS